MAEHLEYCAGCIRLFFYLVQGWRKAQYSEKIRTFTNYSRVEIFSFFIKICVIRTGATNRL